MLVNARVATRRSLHTQLPTQAAAAASAAALLLLLCCRCAVCLLLWLCNCCCSWCVLCCSFTPSVSSLRRTVVPTLTQCANKTAFRPATVRLLGGFASVRVRTPIHSHTHSHSHSFSLHFHSTYYLFCLLVWCWLVQGWVVSTIPPFLPNSIHCCLCLSVCLFVSSSTGLFRAADSSFGFLSGQPCRKFFFSFSKQFSHKIKHFGEFILCGFSTPC